MNKKWITLGLAVAVSLGAISDAPAASITPTLDANLLEAALFQAGGGGIDLSSVVVTVSGHSLGAGSESAGTYTNASGTYGMGAGIVISSGQAGDYGDGPNLEADRTTDYIAAATASQEALLDPISGGPFDHFDVTQIDISFDMLAGFDSIFFNVTFGSEEFDEFIGGSFIDAFGLYVNNTNVAFVDGLPVNIDHPFMGSADGTELNGLLGSAASGSSSGDPMPAIGSLVHTFSASVNPTGNTLTFIIADTADGILDSTAFISQLGGTLPPDPAAVPEPSTFALLGIGGLALVGYGLRRKRQQAA
ncbi:choice-of-anchor L family PEP-CTERM protein [Symmachiella dynata]|uniref:choice-of-anchor L family PEP-CTERM protein n=1 Tax=Symmachiella dynata TaxID=2527995 RepID=UPI0030EBD38C